MIATQSSVPPTAASVDKRKIAVIGGADVAELSVPAAKSNVLDSDIDKIFTTGEARFAQKGAARIHDLLYTDFLNSRHAVGGKECCFGRRAKRTDRVL